MVWRDMPELAWQSEICRGTIRWGRRYMSRDGPAGEDDPLGKSLGQVRPGERLL